ncbi:MAG: DEAD/DEAH box helicase [Cryobacterium sp.]|nr:DEAD/DEAH box helicase [Oligoflexia bacterium]
MSGPKKSSIKVTAPAPVVPHVPTEMLESFKTLDLTPAVARAIEELGYEKPSEIQSAALPILLGDATDFIGLAATGTGKTAAFGIPLLERLNPFEKSVQSIILCPTRELAIQVSGQIDLLGKYQGVKSTAIYGGAPYGDQIAAIRRGAQVVVGTPGRVVDHIDRGTLDLSGVSIVILDEADEMISMGFKDDLEKILGSVAGLDNDSESREELSLGEEAVSTRTSNIWLFSATMSREVRKVTEDYLVNPKKVEINRTEMLPANLEQIYYSTSESNKPEVLCKIMDAADDFYGIIFCQTKALVVDLVGYLMGRGYAVDALHGDMDQKARERTMKAFRDRKVTLLICTDVASRGLDVKDITHVINYSLPRELDSYVHRIGRTARSGKTGYAMSLVTPSHRGLIQRIERATKSTMNEGKIPTRKDVGEKKIAAISKKFEDATTFARATELFTPELKILLAPMSAEEVASRFITMMLPEVFSDKSEREAASPVAGEKGKILLGHTAERAERGYADRHGGARSGYQGRGGSSRGYGGGDRGGYASSGERGGYGERKSYGDRGGDRGGYSSGAERGGFSGERKFAAPTGASVYGDKPKFKADGAAAAPKDKIKRWGAPMTAASPSNAGKTSFKAKGKGTFGAGAAKKSHF